MNGTVEILNGSDARYVVDKSGAVYAVDPPETMFGYLYFAHMIPPEKPGHTLILGYGHGTTAELIRKIWGQCKITGVDLYGYQKRDAYLEYKMEVADAKQFVWEATDSIIKKKYDYISIDLWEGKKVPDFVFDVEFAVRLREMARKYICFNLAASDLDRMKPYHDYGFSFDRNVPIEGNQVTWWSVNEKET